MAALLGLRVKSPMTLAYLVNQYPAPTHSFIRREILALERRGLRVHRFSQRRFAGPLPSQVDRDELARTRVILDIGIVRILLQTLRVAVTSPIRFADALLVATRLGISIWNIAYLMQACVLLRWLRGLEVDHLHAHFGTNSAAVAMLCHQLGGPTYSLTIHGPEDFSNARALHLDEKIAHASFVVGISEFGVSELRRCCDERHWNKLHVVRCGVDESFLDAPNTPAPNEARFVCVGRLCERKMQHVLIEAAAKVRAEVVLIGDGPTRSSLQRLVAEKNVGKSVRMMGWCSQEQVRDEITAARALVLPSSDEGLPVAIMEALALGRPVISTNVAGIPELVQPGISGWLVQPDDVNALVEVMQQAIDAPPSRLTEMGLAGRARVRELHDIDKTAGELIKLFERAIRSTDRG